MSDEKDLVFIVSGGRTGTTFFGEKLSSIIENCFSVHEPDLKYGWSDPRTWRNISEFGVWHMVVGRALGLTGGLPTALRYLTAKISFDEAVKRARIARERYYKKIDKKLIVEANLHWAPMLPVLRGAFPKAKIVVITRDEDSWVHSWLKRAKRHAAEDPVHPSKRLTPITLGETSLASEWPSMSREERLRWEWRFVHNRLCTFAAEDSLTKLYAYEDLFQSDGAGLVSMLEFITAHEERRYKYEFESRILSVRINAA